MLTRRENLLIRPWQERRYIQHRQKVNSALPAIDTMPPTFREHVSCKLKKIQKESERCSQIISENFTLLQHLSNIMSTTRVDHFWDEPPPNFLQRVGIYSLDEMKSQETATEEEDKLEKPKTRKDKCYACSPKRNKIKILPEERMPYSPPKPRVTRRAESPPDWESQYISRCAVDRPEFRGKTWTKLEKKPKTNAKMNIFREETQSLVLSRGGLSLSVKFPPPHHRWARVVPIRHKDNIISSQFVDTPRFVASYETDNNVDMFSLMSHEYAKQWRDEKQATTRVVLETQDNDFLMRRYVIRGYLNKRKVLQSKPRFVMKQFQNIPAKVKIERREDGTGRIVKDDSWPESGAMPETGTYSELADLTNDSLVRRSTSNDGPVEISAPLGEVVDEEDSKEKSDESKQFYFVCQKCCKKKVIKDKKRPDCVKTEPIMKKKNNVRRKTLRPLKENTV